MRICLPMIVLLSVPVVFSSELEAWIQPDGAVFKPTGELLPLHVLLICSVYMYAGTGSSLLMNFLPLHIPAVAVYCSSSLVSITYHKH